jgi:transcriptional regulator NrdR family protein
MPIILLSEGKVKGKTTIHALKRKRRCRSCGNRPSTVFVDKWQDGPPVAVAK